MLNVALMSTSPDAAEPQSAEQRITLQSKRRAYGHVIPSLEPEDARLAAFEVVVEIDVVVFAAVAQRWAAAHEIDKRANFRRCRSAPGVQHPVRDIPAGVVIAAKR
jgi:hypothetical protein